MSRNKASLPLLSEIMRKRREQDRMQKSWYRGRHRIVMLTDKETLISFAGVGDTASWTDLDASLQSDGITPTSISDDTIAVIVQLNVRDSGSAATTTYLQVRPNGSTDNPGHLVARGGHINNMAGYATGIVAVDSNFLLEYIKDASGASTLSGDVDIIGYIEQIS